MSDRNVTISSHPFGVTANGHAVTRYLISDGTMEVSVLTYGAIVSQLKVPGRSGALRDVVLGYDTLEEYETHHCYFGAVVGRCANRIGGGRFYLNGREYILAQNSGTNCLHGGVNGFDRRVWDAEILSDGVRLSLTSPDGDQGFPGELRVTVDYRLSEDRTLSICYRAVSDQDTVCNLTNHSYFNLNGHGTGTVVNHTLQLESDYYTPLNGDFVPDGQILSVEDTPFDFRKSHFLGERIACDHPQIRQAGGYDHNFVLRSDPCGCSRPKAAARAARIHSLYSGIRMEILTTMPGVQLYTPDYEEGMTGKDGLLYQGRCAFCLETQYFPNALAYGHFPKPILPAGEQYLHTTVYRFSIL